MNTDYETLTDRELAVAARGGDQRGLATLYDRYFLGLYDFAIRTLRDTDAAADVVRKTFTEASRQLGEGTVPESVKAWLYGTALREATTGTRQTPPQEGGRRQQAGALPSFVEIDSARAPDPQALQRDGDLRELVWQSATELSPREYALLDLRHRRELTTAELAAAVGIGGDTADATISAVSDTLEQAVVTALLVRRGRRDCPELAALLDRTSTPEVRQAVLAHAQECPRCQRTPADYPSALQILAAFAAVPAAAGLKEVIWLAVVSTGAPAEPVAAAPAGRGRPLLIALLAGLVALAIAVALILLLDSGGDDGLGNPDDIRSTSHGIGEPSSETVVSLVWSRQEGVLAYSVSWSGDRFELPDEVGDLSGDATDAMSPQLTPGEWYFHLRTQHEDGTWTNTVHVGPFQIVAEATPTAEPTAEPTPSPSPQPTPSPTPEPSPSPTPEPTPSPTPEPTPTP